MPNWCYSNITIQSDDKQKLEELYNLILKWTDHSLIENGFGDNWLGNIVEGSGIATYRKENFYDANNKLISCRGTLDYVDFYTQDIMISTDTAWAPATKMWQLICDKYLPSDYEIFYDASEPGCGIFSTNRPDYLNHYILDVCVSNDEGFSEEEYQKLYDADYTENADDNTIIQFLQDLLQTNETDLQNLFDLLHKSKFDDYVSIQPWEYADISVWY